MVAAPCRTLATINDKTPTLANVGRLWRIADPPTTKTARRYDRTSLPRRSVVLILALIQKGCLMKEATK